MRHHIIGTLEDLFHVREAGGTRPVATRAALSVLVPLLVLDSLGRLDVGLFASFAAIYAGPIAWSRPSPGR